MMVGLIAIVYFPTTFAADRHGDIGARRSIAAGGAPQAD